jgi:hypothetical protein
MISPSSVQAVIFQAVGQRFALDGQRVVAGAGQRVGQALEDADVLVMHRRHLAVHQLLGVHDLAAEGFADGLVAQADAEQRNLAGEALIAASETPACAGAQGREMTRWSGLSRAISSSVISSLRNTGHPARARRNTGRCCR